MDNEEDDDQEIGIQQENKAGTANADQEETKGEAGASQSGTNEEGAEGGNKPAYPKRQRKDYGAAYDPNYKNKRGPWRKGQQQQQP